MEREQQRSVSRKPTPRKHTCPRYHHYLQPTRKEGNFSLFYIFSSLNFNRKKIIKPRAFLSQETFRFKLDGALPPNPRQQFHPGREMD